jgi:DNA polymerase-3 subunit alpha
MGIKIRLPHINEGGSDFTLEGDAIRFGLGNVKYISDNIANAIIARRPYTSYEHFRKVTREKGSGINARAVESLNKIGGAAFDDNPRKGNEADNYYELLNIPEFINDLPRWMDAFIKPLEDYEEQGSFLVMAMVKSIKRGDGWSRVELVDKTGSVGVFDKQDTVIETGKQYVILVGDNRIAEYALPDEIRKAENSFTRFLSAKNLNLIDDEMYVVSFSGRKTKKGDKMGNIIFANNDKELFATTVFSGMYSNALVNAKPGERCKPLITQTRSGGLTIKEFTR